MTLNSGLTEYDFLIRYENESPAKPVFRSRMKYSASVMFSFGNSATRSENGLER